jgi:mannosyltransferase OCH1-like enzyme
MDGAESAGYSARVIPRVIYQTWRSKSPKAWTRSERRWVASWRRNRGWAHEIHDDADCLALVRAHYPEHLDTYQSLRPVEKADFWRYLVVHRYGGLYVDFDTSCARAIDGWLRDDDELVLGLMCDLVDKYPDWRPRRRVRSGGGFDPTSGWRDHPVVFTNWAFAARPGHPLLAEVIRRLVINASDPYFLEEDTSWIVKKTGPGVVTDALNDYLEAHGTSATEVARRLRRERDVRVGDVRLLDYAAWHWRYLTHYGMRTWEPSRQGLELLLNRLRMALS